MDNIWEQKMAQLKAWVDRQVPSWIIQLTVGNLIPSTASTDGPGKLPSSKSDHSTDRKVQGDDSGGFW